LEYPVGAFDRQEPTDALIFLARLQRRPVLRACCLAA
jgi:hypothetical protein